MGELAAAAARRRRLTRTFPLRVRLARGRVVHAGWTDRMYIPGPGLTGCGTQYEPSDEQLPADTPVTCAGRKKRKTVREG